MDNRKDITDTADIRLLVDEFYARALADELLGPVFSSRISAEKWPAHKARIYLFWETVLLGVEDPEKRYGGSPFAPHIGLELEAAHFEKWLELFNDTVRKYFEGPKTDETVWRASQMAQLFLYKLTAMKTKGNIPLV
ncbi:MAG: group III truncated hemoglobin [Bacteroidia bacterium]